MYIRMRILGIHFGEMSFSFVKERKEGKIRMVNRNKNAALTLLIVVALLFSNLGLAYGQSAEQVSDIKSSWAKEQISRWVDQGLVTGYADKTFKPGNTISRAEFVAMINRVFGFREQDESMFKDVSKDKWYYTEIAKAKLAGYISGFEDGAFKPEANVSRQEAAKIIYDLMKLNNGSDESALAGFQDTDLIPKWSRPYLNAVNASGYIKGYPDQTLRPLQSITRAEAVVLLDKVVGNLIQSSGTVGGDEEKTVHGNVTINAAGVTLKNTRIEGDLHLAAGIGEGEVYLDNVTVQGRTLVAGGGENSIILINTTLDEVIVDKVSGKVRLLSKGDTVVLNTIIKTAVKLQEENQDKDKGFVDVEITDGEAGDNVQLQGEFQKVIINKNVVLDVLESTEIGNLETGAQAEGSTVNVQDGSTLANVVLNASVDIKGKGIIQIVIINTNGSTIEQNVARYELGGGVILVIIGGIEIKGNPTAPVPTGPTAPPVQGPAPTPAPIPDITPNPDPNLDPDLLPEAEGVFIIGNKVYSYFGSAGDYSSLSYDLADSVTEAVYYANYTAANGNIGEFNIEGEFIPAAEYATILYNDSYFQFYEGVMLDTVTVNEVVYGHVYYGGTESISYRMNDYTVSDLTNQLPAGAEALTDGDQITLFYGDLVLQATWSGIGNKWVLGEITKGLDAPTSVTAQPISNTEIKLQWQSALGAEYYYVYVSDSLNGTYTSIVDGLNQKLKITGTTYSDTNNLPHTTKFYKITAASSGFNLESPYSEAASATTYYNEHLSLSFTATDTVQHPSEPIIYMSDKAGKKVYAFNYLTKAMSSVAFDLPPESITYANGELFVSLLKMEHSSTASVESGAIAIVSAADLSITTILDIDIDPYDIAVGRNGYIYVSSGSNQWTDMKSYSRATQLEVEASQIRHRSFIQMHPTLDKLYAINTDTSPRDISAYNLLNGQFVEASYPGGYDSPYHGDYSMTTNFKLSPDGRYIFNGAGTVFESTNSQYDDMNYVYRLNSSFTDIAFDLGSERFYTTNNTIVGVYDYDNFQQSGMYHTDGTGKILFNGNDQIIALSVLGGSNIIEFIDKSSLEQVDAPQEELGVKLGGTIADIAYDLTNHKAYAIDEAFRKLLLIDLATNSVVQTVELTYKPSGLTLSEDGTKLFIVNRDENYLVTEVNISDLSISRHLAYTAAADSDDSSDRHVYNKSNNLYVVIGDWAPKLLVFNASTFANVNYGTEIVSVGDMVFSSDNSKFYYWFQYGWGAGNAGSDVYAYSINGGGTSYTQIDKTVLGYPNMSRDPLDTPIFLVEDKGIIIAKDKVLNLADLELKGSLAEPIFAVSPDGSKAVGKAGIYDLSTYAKIESISLSGARELFYDKNSNLHYLMGDVLYSK